MVEFTACLSARAFSAALVELICGRYLLRPDIVETYPVRRQLVTISFVNFLIP